MATTSVVLDTASSSMASPQALSPVAEAVLSKMAVVSDEVCLNMMQVWPMYNLRRPLIRDVLFCFLSVVAVTNWAAQ